MGRSMIDPFNRNLVIISEWGRANRVHFNAHISNLKWYVTPMGRHFNDNFGAFRPGS